jgi:hypothetical protein
MSVEPAAQERSAPPDTAITVHFDRPVQDGSVTPRAFAVFGRWSGPAQGEFRISDEGRAVTLIPDGDGAADVATANEPSDNASVLLGDGRGGLRPAQTVSVARLSLASDLGDLDGDGDLDWIVSNFERGWTILRNDGRGIFAVGDSTRRRWPGRARSLSTRTATETWTSRSSTKSPTWSCC